MADRKVQIDLGINPPAGAASVFEMLARKAEETESKVKGLRGGMNAFGQTAIPTVNRLNESIGKLQSGLSILSTSVPQLAGVQGVLQTIGGMGGLLGSVGPVGLGVAAAFAAMGSAAVLASPQIAEGMGGALNEVTGRAKESLSVLDRLRERMALQNSAAMLGIGTSEMEARAGREQAIRQPFELRVGSLTERAAAERDRMIMGRLIPQRAFNATQRREQAAQQDLHLAMSGQGGGSVADAMQRMQSAMEFRPEISTDARRERLMASRALGRSEQELQAAQQAQATFMQQRDAGRQMAEATTAWRNSVKAMEDAQRKLASLQSAVGVDRSGQAAMRVGPQQAEVERLRREAADRERAMRETQARLGTRLVPQGQVTEVQGQSVDERVRRAMEDRQQNLERVRRAEAAINSETLAVMKQRHATVENEIKSVQQLLRLEEQRVKAVKSAFILMDPVEQMQALETVKKAQAGAPMSVEEMRKLSQIPGAEKTFEQFAAAQADQNPLFKEFAEAVQLFKQGDDIRNAEAIAIEFKGQLERKIELKLQNDAGRDEDLARQLANQFVAMIREENGFFERRLKELAAREVQAALERQQAERRGAGGR